MMMRPKEERWDWVYLSIAVVLAIVAVGMAYPVFAGDDKAGIPKTPRTGENIPSTTVDALSASSSAATANPILTANSGGGQSSSNLYESSDYSALAFGTESPIPIEMEGGVLPACWLPTSARSYVFGIYAASSRYKRNRDCMADLEAARAHELEVLKLRAAEADASEASVERALAECGWEQVCAASK